MIEPQGPSIFRWRHFAPEVILCAARGCLRYSLSFCDVFFLLPIRSADAAKQLFSKALPDPSHPQPRVINTDKAEC